MRQVEWKQECEDGTMRFLYMHCVVDFVSIFRGHVSESLEDIDSEEEKRVTIPV